MHTKDKGIKGEGMITRNNKLFIILAVSVLICVVTAFGTRRYIYIYIGLILISENGTCFAHGKLHHRSQDVV